MILQNPECDYCYYQQRRYCLNYLLQEMESKTNERKIYIEATNKILWAFTDDTHLEKKNISEVKNELKKALEKLGGKLIACESMRF